MSSLDVLRGFAGRFRAGEHRIDMLADDAGVMPTKREEAVDGLGLTIVSHGVVPFVPTDG